MSSFLRAGVTAALIAYATSSLAQTGQFDRRSQLRSRGADPQAAQLDAIAGLQEQLGGTIVATFDEDTGVTRSLMNAVGPLTGPSDGDPADVALRFVEANLELLGLDRGDTSGLELCDRVYSRVSGMTHLYFCQTFYGIPVFNAQLQVNVSGDGSIAGVNNSFVPGLRRLTRARSAALEATDGQAVGIDETDNPRPGIAAADAVMSAASHLGISATARPRSSTAATGGRRQRTELRAEGISREPVPSELAWLPIGLGVKLVWSIDLATPDGRHVYRMNVDATEGLGAEDAARVLTRFDMVSDTSYFVYPTPVESPNHTSPAPPDDGRELVTDPAIPEASPLGWHDNGTQTFQTMRGNNVHAYDDRNFDNQPPATEPVCPGGDCTFAIDLTNDPATYTAASIANVFYWTNRVHDIQYLYGFDEAAGNFQTNNFGLGGNGGDALKAEVQDGSGTNNANMLTPADGSAPRMQMYLWTQTTPKRDAGLDAGVIVHEYGHGISNRLVGGRSNVFCLSNQQQPGEGLSDFWALAYTARATDTANTPRGIGTYVKGQPTDGLGIRTQHYSLDPAFNTHTYESINGMAVPHGVGEVWAQAAWEVYWALVAKHGFDPDLSNASGNAGNQRMMLYVNEGLKSTACSPAFTHVRDGILQAAANLHGGEDVCTIWSAFADFGLGVNAVSGGSSSTSPTNGFDVPASCVAGPRMLSPTPGTTLSSADVTFTWEPNGESVSAYELWVGTSEGASDLFFRDDLGTALSADVNDLPEDGTALYVRLRFLVSGVWDFRDYTYQAKVSPPGVFSPPPDTTFDSDSVTFEWEDRGTPVLDYWVYVGSTLGGKEVLDSGSLGKDTHLLTVSDLPTDGSTVYVRLWWFVQVGGWQWADTTYTATDVPVPSMVSPTPGATFSGPSVVFTWTPNGASVSNWQLVLGSTLGGQDLFVGTISPATTATANNLPTNGNTVHARLNYEIAGVWSFLDFQYTAAVGQPELYAPTPGTTLTGAEETFQWRSNGSNVLEWWLYVGSTVGGKDIFDSGSVLTATSVLVSNIPTDGSTIHVQLWYRISGQLWKANTYVYTAAALDPTMPEITSPLPGSTLPGTTQVFTWDAHDAPVTAWWLYVGTVPLSYNIKSSGNLGLATSYTVTNLPTDGRAVYVTLWFQISGSWHYEIYPYITADLAPVITSPIPGSVLPGTNTTFAWAANPNGAAVSAWALYVGTTVGGNNYHNSGATTATTANVMGLPTDGSTVHARLWYQSGSVWRTRDFQFIAASIAPPAFTSPLAGTVLAGPTQTFTWAPDPAFQPVTEWWLYVGSSPGARNYYDSGALGASRSATVTTLPTNGSVVYARIWYKSFGRWFFVDATFIASS